MGRPLPPRGRRRRRRADGPGNAGGPNHVAYQKYQWIYGGSEIVGRTDLFLVDIAGETPGAPVNLTGGLPADTEVYLLGHLTPDAAQVVFETRLPDFQRGPLYMVPLSPTVGAPVQLSADGESIHGYSVLRAQ